MKYKYLNKLRVWLPVLLGLILLTSTLFLSRFYLEVFSNEKVSAFEKQNIISLANRDSMALSYTLSNLEDEYNVNCIRASYDGNQFFVGHHPEKRCKPSFFKIEKIVSVGTDKKLEVHFLFRLPNQVLVILVFFFILEVLILIAIYYSTKKLEVDKNAQHQLFNAIAKRAAHDLRSPLSALSSISYTFPDKNDSRYSLLENTIHRINLIANELLENNKMILTTNSSIHIDDLKGLITSLIEEKQQSLTKSHKNINFNLNINSNLKLTASTSLEIFRVLSNIIQNSIEAISEIGKISISTNKNTEDKSIIITITDTGSGIPADILDKVGKIELTTKSNGNGLGLISSIERIQSLNGDLSIHPNLPHGTIVEIKLPMNA